MSSKPHTIKNFSIKVLFKENADKKSLLNSCSIKIKRKIENIKIENNTKNIELITILCFHKERQAFFFILVKDNKWTMRENSFDSFFDNFLGPEVEIQKKEILNKEQMFFKMQSLHEWETFCPSFPYTVSTH
jgi:hypothetical protein